MLKWVAVGQEQTIGRYAIHREIASGGMASVHFGRLNGPSGFARTVAIKRAHPHLARDKDFADMFMDEARLAARIHHPNVVPMLDVIETPDDLVLVMEYVHGEPVSRLLQAAKEKGEPVPPAVAASIIIDTLHGLHAAHDAKSEQGEPLNIVHRDVSPQNILVGVDGISRLVDFGIAKAAGRLHQTRDSSVKGKYAYMSPEQVRGQPVDRLTDIYAASIVFWELLTGERLFLGTSEAETIQKCLMAVVRPASELARDLDPRLDAILARGLARDPADRYSTAREMALEIEACMPAVRPSEVGAWVARTAGEQLVLRGNVLAEIEREDLERASRTRARAAGSDGRIVARVVGPRACSGGVGAAERGHLDGGGGRGSTVRPGRRRRHQAEQRSGRKRPRPRSCLQRTGGNFWPRERSARPWRAPRGPHDDWVKALPTAPATAYAPSRTATPSPDPSATGSARAPAHGAPRSGHGKHGGGPNCDPPYTIDGEGRVIFRHECL